MDDKVSIGVFQQVMWERDVALAQLAEIGKGLGAKMDDVRPLVKSRWDHIEQFDGHAMGECSNCLKVRIVDNFCPNCGADMREVDDAK